MNAIQYQVGVARANITPSDWQNRTYWLAGFDANRPANRVNDPLYARAMIVDDGTIPMAIVTMDLIGLTSPDVRRIQTKIAEAVPELANRILIHATHTHEAPDVVGLWGGAGAIPFLNPRPLDYIDTIATKAANAVKTAWTRRQPATVKVANLDQAVLDDLVVDYRPPNVSDPAARLLVFSNSNNRVIGTLVNWASHPEVLGNENRAITADFVKWVVDEMDAELGGQTLFVNGAIGGLLTSESDRILPNLPRESFEKAEAIGRDVAQRLVRQLNTPGLTDQVTTYATLPPINYQTRKFYLPIENPLFLGAKTLNRVPTTYYSQNQIPVEERWRPDALSATRYVQTEANFIDFGPFSILTMGGELYPELLVGGVDPSIGIAPYDTAPIETPLVNNSGWATDPTKFFFGLTNDFLGYFVPQTEWDGWFEGYYGEQFSPAPDAGSILSYNLHLLMLGYETGEYPNTLPEFLARLAPPNYSVITSETKIGTDQNDGLSGALGNDTLWGRRGDDTLQGHDGHDRLIGNQNNDVLIGGLGNDTLTGGLGRDRFVYQQVDDRLDIITDFNPSRDVIQLRPILNQSIYTSDTPFEDYVRLAQRGANVRVRVDSDGGQPGAFKTLLFLENVSIDRIGAEQFLV